MKSIPQACRLVSDTVLVRRPEEWKYRTSEQTARYDRIVALPPGVYEYVPTTIAGKRTTYDDAYYFKCDTEGELVAGGYDNENPRAPHWRHDPDRPITRVRVVQRIYGYAFREANQKGNQQ